MFTIDHSYSYILKRGGIKRSEESMLPKLLFTVQFLSYGCYTSSVEWVASKKLLLKYMLPDTSLSKYIRTDGTTVDKTKEASNEIVLRLPVALGYYNLSFYNFFDMFRVLFHCASTNRANRANRVFFNRKECRSTT